MRCDYNRRAAVSVTCRMSAKLCMMNDGLNVFAATSQPMLQQVGCQVE